MGPFLRLSLQGWPRFLTELAATQKAFHLGVAGHFLPLPPIVPQNDQLHDSSATDWRTPNTHIWLRGQSLAIFEGVGDILLRIRKAIS